MCPIIICFSKMSKKKLGIREREEVNESIYLAIIKIFRKQDF